jgi:hypothetical protein
MTIEIKQLVIRAVADPGRERNDPVAQVVGFPAQAANSSVRAEPNPIDLDRERQTIVAACVREVMRKLERARDR